MKIAFLVYKIPPSFDGVGQYSWNLAEKLREWGHDTRLFTSRPSQPHPPAQPPWVHPDISSWDGPSVLRAIRSQGFDPDWCNFQFVPSLYGRYGICRQAAGIPLFLKRHSSCRVVTTLHEFLTPWRLHPRDFLLATISRQQTRRLLRGSTLALTTCRRYQDLLVLLGDGTCPVQVLPVGSNILNAPENPEKIQELRERHGLSGACVLGMFGRLSEARNFQTGLRTLTQAIQAGVPARLLLVGNTASSNPPLFRKLMDSAKQSGVDRFILSTGDLPVGQISAFLQLIDLFLFPQCDGISTRNTTLMAALAHGLPIVAYAPQSGNWEQPEVPGGRLVPQGNEAEFIRASLELLQDPGKQLRFSSANKLYFDRHFSWSSIARRYVEILQNG